MEFRLLGTVEAFESGRSLRLGGAKERALLAYLLLHANEVVSRDHLIEELWGERAPPSAEHGLDVYVSRLRKTLAGDGAALVTRARGYELQVDPDRIDLERFEGLVAQGARALRRGDLEQAVETLEGALTLWRGQPFSDLAAERFVVAASTRIEERRLEALELRIEAELALGRSGSLIGELEALSRAHPLRERFSAQLMLALYRTGRQADALAVYRQTRARLVEELGIEPGEELRRLEQAILRHDPALDAPGVPAGGGRPPRPVLVAAVMAGLLVTAAALTAAFLLGRSPGGLPRLQGDSIGLVDSATHRLLADVVPGSAPSRVAAGLGAVWVASAGAGTVTQIDPRTRSVRQTMFVGGAPAGIAVGRRAVWTIDALNGRLLRIDPATYAVVQTIRVGNNPTAVAVGGGSVWVTLGGEQSLLRVDEQTGDPLDRIDTGADGRAVAVGGGAVWVADERGNRVLRVSVRTGAVGSAVGVGRGPSALAFGGGALWVASSADQTISRVDPHSGSVTAVGRIDAPPTAIAAGADVWVGDEHGDVHRVDSKAAVVRSTTYTSRPVQALAVDGAGVWTAVVATAREHRGGTLRVRAVPGQIDATIDPAVDFAVGSWAVLLMTNDGLTTFRKAAGSDGTQLVPDLARALPAVSDGGRTYTFTLRRGIRYSNGRLVRATDFRFALERVFRLRSPGVGYYATLLGADACLRTPARCDLSRAVVARGDTVAFHLATADTELPEKLALPYAYAVPATTPVRNLRAATVPATGPYLVRRHLPNRLIVLVRNPRFREWSRLAQPDGYPDRIVIRTQTGADAAVDAAANGRVDSAWAPISPAKLAELQREHPGQVRRYPLADTLYFFLNTKAAPFDDVRVRRALNFAVDRGRLVAIRGGAAFAQATCQVLPPGLPGYRPYCPYTARPDPSGAWHGRDLAAARRLIAASGTRGRRVDVLTFPGDWPPRWTRYVAGVLRELGYDARVRTVPGDRYMQAAIAPDAQIGLTDWIADYPRPSDYFTTLLSCSGQLNLARFCDPRLDGRMRRAVELQQTDLARANALWASIEREVVDRAVWLPFLTPRLTDVVSRRVGNYTVSPQWTTLLDQLWVR